MDFLKLEAMRGRFLARRSIDADELGKELDKATTAREDGMVEGGDDLGSGSGCRWGSLAAVSGGLCWGCFLDEFGHHFWGWIWEERDLGFAG